MDDMLPAADHKATTPLALCIRAGTALQGARV